MMVTRLSVGDRFDLRLEDAGSTQWQVDRAPEDAIGICDGCGESVAGLPIAHPADDEGEQQWHTGCFLDDLTPYTIENLR